MSCRPVLLAGVALCFLLFSLFLQEGRIGSSINGTALSSDQGIYASIAAAEEHPELFARDVLYAHPELYNTHATILASVLRLLAWDDNYGLAYLRLTAFCSFLHYMGFFLLGCALFRKSWQALLFSLIMGQCYWIRWGTYWGNGYLDYAPRTIFTALYALSCCVFCKILTHPRGWPLFLGATGLLVYVHAISTLPVALGFWLSFAASKPPQKTWLRHGAWLLFSGCCFLVVITPFALRYIKPSIPLTAADAALLHQILVSRYDVEFSAYWKGIFLYFRDLTLLPLFPAALLGTWYLRRYGNEQDRFWLKHLGLWTLAVAVCTGIFLLDQELAHLLHRPHLEFDLIRVLRFPVFFALCIILLACAALLRQASSAGKHLRSVRLLTGSIFLVLLLSGNQDTLRSALSWFWNSRDPLQKEEHFGPLLRQAEMVDAVKNLTPPGSLIFCPENHQAIRYTALRALAFNWKDTGPFYYAQAVDKLRQWEEIRRHLASSPTAYIDLAVQSGADYLVSSRPQDHELLKNFGKCIWSNEQYLLIQRSKASP